MRTLTENERKLIIESGLFDSAWYSKRFADVSMLGLDPLEHYFRIGIYAGRDPGPLFSGRHYLERLNGRRQTDFPLLDYLHLGWHEQLNPHPLFDVGFYLDRNEDIRDAGLDPLRHFRYSGGLEGRQPHPAFPTHRVLERCPHLRESRRNPLEYYLSREWTEDPCPEATAYLSLCRAADPAQHSSVSLAKPLEHIPTANIGAGASVATDIRAIAIYLPQFHAIPENDAWWGMGFTEWTNVRRAAPQYAGHYQPHVPHPDLGYYELNDATVLEKQAAMARAAGIEGFCFYYYWFNGRRLLNMPTDRLLAIGKPDFPFCFCWANENWTRTWDGGDKEILIGQEHSHESDERFILDLLPAFRDPRYIRVEGKPLLIIYRPGLLPDPAATTRHWREVCRREGIGEIFLSFMLGFESPKPFEIGFDAAIQMPPLGCGAPVLNNQLDLHDPERFAGEVRDYRDAVASLPFEDFGPSFWPAVCPSWDNTARRMERAHSWIHSSPEIYHQWLSTVVQRARQVLPPQQRFVFINAWNEWAEGCHLEPDEKHGYAWLNATRLAVTGEQPPSEGYTKSKLISSRLKTIAIHLPQFHPFKENNEWWGEGFTEWTNVRKAKPLFAGHAQPRVPTELAYYDLRASAVRTAQAALARSHGIDGFCYYHYWFHGKRLMTEPLDAIFESSEPDFPFCLCWANETWSRRWLGEERDILIEQTYSLEDNEQHSRFLAKIFANHRYIRLNGRPLFVIYRPTHIPVLADFISTLRECSRAVGVGDPFLLGCSSHAEGTDMRALGFDGTMDFQPKLGCLPEAFEDNSSSERLARNRALGVDSPHLRLYDAEEFRQRIEEFRDQLEYPVHPSVFVGWDNSPRRGENGIVLLNNTSEDFAKSLHNAKRYVNSPKFQGEKVVFINAWNEWAEGNYLEPDEKHGYAWLNATRQAFQESSTAGTLGRHPAILAARRAKLDFFLGRSTPVECETLLIHHTALLSIFHRRGGRLLFQNGSLSAAIGGETFPLGHTKDLARLAEKIWGSAASIPFCFVLLQFNNSAHTRQCVESIKRLNPHGHRVHIVIVDNASSAETEVATRNAFENDGQVSLIFNKENLGFSRGNNLGYRLARERFGSAFVVVANNDVVFEDSEFLAKCANLYREKTYSVLGPDIVTPDGRHESPWNDYVYSVDEWRDLRTLYQGQRETYNRTGRAEFQKAGERHPEHTLILDSVLQGACLVFSPVFVETRRKAFDESLFLYGEEFPLAVDCMISGHMSIYSNSLAIRHEEAVSTNLIPEKRKIHHGYDGALNGIELALLRLERQADAIAGRAMAMDNEKIRKLVNDGRRHVLVDLFFCQPGFHGGGEYGKAVFGGLAETAQALPGLQLWVALDPDLFIDDWILEECRRSAIYIVRVKSYDEIAALVNLGIFHSFFAPAIVVYTGYEYMKRLGGELKFDRQTKTKVVGTIHDLRDFELGRQWGAVATARKKAGCLPEVGFSEFNWNSEKSKQAAHSRELAEMYRGICNHKSLKTLVTVSDYSAQSIRANANRIGPIDILFAPEKNRPKPESFDWPGIDFKTDPYLVVLSAGRVEKNAVSAVAAFDALFTEPEFAKANPQLKLVLVGIHNPADLGIPTPQERARVLAIPPLPPAGLEFLLKNARGLLYPSFNEGFGYPPLEAMSLGVPCVVSNQTSIPEVCGTAAVYCDPFSIDSIATAIKELLSAPADPESLKAHAEKIRRRQSSDLRKLCELVLDEPPRPVHHHLGWCPVCEKEVRFTANHEWLRDHYLCPGCGSIPRERALMHILQERFPNWRDLRIHESSPVNRGASAKLAAGCKNYIHSQFDPELGFGNTHPTKGYRSEDLERQTFGVESFDLVVSQDVMEHVFDAEAAFRDIHRTLKPGGMHIFTTPLVKKGQPSQCRAALGSDGSVVHLSPPEFHGNPMSEEGSLVTWDWGFDITQKITAAGAGNAEIIDATDKRMGIEGELLEVVIQSKLVPISTSTFHA